MTDKNQHGISIMVPIYNWDCRTMVHTLHEQGKRCGVSFEIICMDDASSVFVTENASLQDLSSVRYVRLEHNIGRSVIRNRLAKQAEYDYLLFLDCDSGIQEGFMESYVKYINQRRGVDVVVGGRIYEKEEPNSTYLLHWLYGKKNENKNKKFQSCNFLIRKSLFNEIGFEESIKGYGHEDTLFGIALYKREVKIKHIKAPVVHLDLKENATFLLDYRNALRNAYKSWKIQAIRPSMKSVPLIRLFEQVQRINLSGFLAKQYVAERERYEEQLCEAPSLRRFKLYQLRYLCYLLHKKNKRLHL